MEDRSSHSAVFVMPTGNDHASGRSINEPFRTLERAQATIAAGEADTVYIDGIFHLDRAFTIKPSPRAQRWLALPGRRAILDGDNKAPAGLIVTGRAITVKGLHITRFTANGIVIGDADDVLITDNTVSHINSDTWTEAAILAVQHAKNITVSHNIVFDTGYVGIGFFSSVDGQLGGARVINNVVRSTCRKVTDCGAIYISGRSSSSYGAVVTDNYITDYGPNAAESKAIYLDDGLSYARVSNNRITGSGSYAFHIHGGSHNIISNNIVDLPHGQPLLFHQEFEGVGVPNMSDNVLANNVIRAPSVRTLNIKLGGTAKPILKGNRITGR